MNNPNTTKLDPDVSALVISQALVLRRVIETATNVRNLMYEFLINDKVVTKVTPVMFHKAINKLSETPSFNYGDFDRALNAAGTIPNKIITMYKEIICDEIGFHSWNDYGEYQRLLTAFTAFPDAANPIQQPSWTHRSTKLKHLSKLSNLFHIMLDKYVDIRSPSKKTRKLFDKASTLNARRAADDAWNAARDAYPMCAASSAVMIVDTHPDLQDFIRHTAQITILPLRII